MVLVRLKLDFAVYLHSGISLVSTERMLLSEALSDSTIALVIEGYWYCKVLQSDQERDSTTLLWGVYPFCKPDRLRGV